MPMSYFLCDGCWWANYFASRSEVGVFLQSCFGSLWCFSSGPGVWWPSDLVLKSSGPITFDSRSRVNYLVQVWFWAFLRVLSMDQRLCGGESCLIFRKEGGCGSIWVMRTGFSLTKVCFFWGE